MSNGWSRKVLLSSFSHNFLYLSLHLLSLYISLSFSFSLLSPFLSLSLPESSVMKRGKSQVEHETMKTLLLSFRSKPVKFNSLFLSSFNSSPYLLLSLTFWSFNSHLSQYIFKRGLNISTFIFSFFLSLFLFSVFLFFLPSFFLSLFHSSIT